MRVSGFRYVPLPELRWGALPQLASHVHPLLPLAELVVAYNFAIEQHSGRGLKACPATPEAGIDPLPTNFEVVRGTMKGIRRIRGAAPIRKAPATHGIISDMIACFPDTLRGTRDRALLLLGFADVLRR
jgi:hypothetical protein